MPQQYQDNDSSRTARRRKRLIWLTAIVVVMVAITAYFTLTYKSVDEELAEIEAARAIPDSENAAFIYNELLAEYQQIPRCPAFLDGDADSLTMRQPWNSADYPELAEWIKTHKPLTERLLQASKFDKCRFRIDNYTYEQVPILVVDRSSAMCNWAFLLARAANNDIAEDRTNDAIAKYRCLTQLAKHVYQQPLLVEYLFGTAIEQMALHRLMQFLIQGNPTESQVKTIEDLLMPTQDNWSTDSRPILRVDRLLCRRTFSLQSRIEAWWTGISRTATFKKAHEIYLSNIASRRALRIMIVLRRYKDQHSRWPTNLDDVRLLAPAEAFVDPIAGDSFVYKLADDAFRLYSKGRNKIDEDGQNTATFDPNTGKVTQYEDDKLFWPPREPKTKKENTDDK
jgi:hypothetical protein